MCCPDCSNLCTIGLYAYDIVLFVTFCLEGSKVLSQLNIASQFQKIYIRPDFEDNFTEGLGEIFNFHASA